jgi:hypothetical protein
MTVQKLNVAAARDLLNDFRFKELFNEIGWSVPKSKKADAFTAGEARLSRTPIAELSGIVVYEVGSDTGGVPDRKTLALASREISKTTLEHVLVFVDRARTQSVWYWVKREGSKRQPREHYYFKGQPGDLFLSKIASLVVDLSELDQEGHLPLIAAAEKVKRALDVERVIKRFFKDYDEQRIAFTNLITGIPDDGDRRWYASVLLNRLMFIYFLQKRFFLDGGDGLYLENKLEQSRGDYFQRFLKVLFFEAFAKPEEMRSAEAVQLTGDIRYLNGGLFLPHSLEQRYDIDVPDQAFADLYKLFSHYSWNLNDIPGESDDDINPDVLGYIFEKYINQKEFGAYYTRPEITEYLCEQTIHRLILDRINEPALAGIPAGRNYDSVPEMLIRLDKATARKLLHDVLPDLTILDPAVGSGAFLVAALKTLLTVYSAVVGWLQFHDRAWLDLWLEDCACDLDRVQYAIKKAIITDNLYGVDIMEEATEIAKLRLFMTLVASAHNVEELEPLPNIDFNLLPGNSLVGLLRVEDAEFEELRRRQGQGSLFETTAMSYRRLLDEKNRRVEVYRHASGYTEDLVALRASVDAIKGEARPVLNDLLMHELPSGEIKFEQATWDEKSEEEGRSIKRPLRTGDIDGLQPFHWGFEFDKVLHERGGFDAIITNPPWVVVETSEKEFFRTYDPTIGKNKITIEEWTARKPELLKVRSVRDAWLAYLTESKLTSDYFKATPQYEFQKSYIEGKNVGAKTKLQFLFLERCYRLIKPRGLVGIVMPSDIYTDLGGKSLRRLLFDTTAITGLFGFENRKLIFENVHRSFKPTLLSFVKAGKTESFVTAFMRSQIGDIEKYPNHLGFTITTAFVEKTAPLSLSISEIKDETEYGIALKFAKFPLLGCSIDSWELRLSTELNMTTHKALFGSSSLNRLPLYEGKMVHKFTHCFAPGTRWVDEKEARRVVGGKGIRPTDVLPYQRYRIAYRAVARSNDERTLIATILPKNCFYAHSLNAVRSPLSAADSLYLLACLNSFACEFQLRQAVSANITMPFVYQLAVPKRGQSPEVATRLIEIAAKLICTTTEYQDLWNEANEEVGLGGEWAVGCGVEAPALRLVLVRELDALVAQAYGLSQTEFAHVVSTFNLVDSQVREATIDEFNRLDDTRQRNLSDPVLSETIALLADGENDRVEFKQSLEAISFDETPLREKGHSEAQIKQARDGVAKSVVHSALKTICAFLNADGGVLLLGAHDDGYPVGLAPDLDIVKGKNKNGFELKLRALLTSRFEPAPVGLGQVVIRFVTIEGKMVCRVDVKPDRMPHHLDGEVFVRDGNNTLLLKGAALTNWISRRTQ